MIIIPVQYGHPVQTYHPTSAALAEAAKSWLSAWCTGDSDIRDEADIALDAAICAEFPDYAGSLDSFFPACPKSEHGRLTPSVQVTDTDGDHFFVTAVA